jgi:hypothetical protein
MPDNTANNHITDCEFSIIDPPLPLGWTAPAIEFDAESSHVTIRDEMEIGAPDCREAALESASYNSRTETLAVVVFNAKTANHPDNNPSNSGCSDAMGADAYRITVHFATALPETVTVTKRYEEGHYTITETITETNPF